MKFSMTNKTDYNGKILFFNIKIKSRAQKILKIYYYLLIQIYNKIQNNKKNKKRKVINRSNKKIQNNKLSNRYNKKIQNNKSNNKKFQNNQFQNNQFHNKMI